MKEKQKPLWQEAWTAFLKNWKKQQKKKKIDKNIDDLKSKLPVSSFDLYK